MTSSHDERPRVLCVDDERRVLEGIRRHLRRDFDLTLATSASAALECLQSEGPFPVMVSDLAMPGMNGIELLSRAQEVAPDTVRILLTGHADAQSAAAAVNEGKVFRFLTKPCPAGRLAVTLRAAVRQHRLVTAEKVLLEQTLHGAVKVLTDILALVEPTAFGRATRLKLLASELARHLDLPDRWQYEVAAMLSQLGVVILDEELVQKLHQGEPLSLAERERVDGLPEVTQALLANIPRLEGVRESLRWQNRLFGGGGTPADGPSGTDIPLGARILRLVIDYDELDGRGRSLDDVFNELRSRKNVYDPELFEAFLESRARREEQSEVQSVRAHELAPGMVFVEDCTTVTGRLLVARGQEVTRGLVARVRNFAENEGVQEPIRVRVCGGAGGADAADGA